MLNILDKLLPQHCVFCLRRSNNALSLCANCYATLPWLQHSCKHCSRAMTGNSHTRICGHCLKYPDSMPQVISVFHYDRQIKQLISELKFAGRLAHTHLLARLLQHKLEELYQNDCEMPSCIIPVPLHNKRLRQRGFNQALEIARPLANALGCQLDRYCVQRIKATTAQTLVALEKRMENLQNAFNARYQPGEYVAIIDDVVTSGATIKALSQALKHQGVVKVVVWSIAIAY